MTVVRWDLSRDMTALTVLAGDPLLKGVPLWLRVRV